MFGGLPSVVQECCWDICEKSVMGFVLLSVCQSLLNFMVWDFKISGVLKFHIHVTRLVGSSGCMYGSGTESS